MSLAKKKQHGAPHKVRIGNRKARHKFHILEKIECGLALTGTEVKSLRSGQATVDEGYARIRNGEVFLVGVNIAQYPSAAGKLQHDPTRERKLLLRRRQIAQLETHVRQKGRTLVPLAIYFKDSWAKCELGVAVGKRQYDKRESIKKRDQQRDMAREMRQRRR
ncbi:MAG: SsrA-binding protein SmpB [Phycisphaerae bacterium]